MRGVIIGSGNVARCFGSRLVRGGHKITQVYSLHLEHSGKLALEWHAAALRSLQDIDPFLDFYLLAVRDDVLSQVASALSVRSGILIHTSGSLPIEILQVSGAESGVIYPLQTIHSRTGDQVEIPLLLEASSSSAMEGLKLLSASISETIREVSSPMRLHIHLAAVVSNNFISHLLNLWSRYCSQQGIDTSIFNPLVTETIRGAMQQDRERIQTGPAVRGDVLTIAKHLKLLENQPELQHLYKEFSESIRRLQS